MCNPSPLLLRVMNRKVGKAPALFFSYRPGASRSECNGAAYSSFAPPFALRWVQTARTLTLKPFSGGPPKSFSNAAAYQFPKAILGRLVLHSFVLLPTTPERHSWTLAWR